MSKYTTEVRFICEQANGLNQSKGYKDIDSILDVAIGSVFSFDFPIFDENYRKVLEKKILKHYYTREICEETVGLWKLRLDTRLNEIMPYYNKLYNSELLEFNPLYTVDLTRTRKTDLDSKRNENESVNDETKESENSEFKKTGTVSSDVEVRDSGSDTLGVIESGNVATTGTKTDNVTVSGSNSNTNIDLYSDTPQGALSGVESQTYLTNARKVTDSATNSGTNTDVTTYDTNVANTGNSTNTTTYGKKENSDGVDTYNITETNGKEKDNTYNRTRENEDNLVSTEDYLEKVAGFEGTSGSELLLKYRETFLNIDMMIIRDLEDLFFQLW